MPNYYISAVRYIHLLVSFTIYVIRLIPKSGLLIQILHVTIKIEKWRTEHLVVSNEIEFSIRIMA